MVRCEIRITQMSGQIEFGNAEYDFQIGDRLSQMDGGRKVGKKKVAALHLLLN